MVASGSSREPKSTDLVGKARVSAGRDARA